jgi:hypothetical protein
MERLLQGSERRNAVLRTDDQIDVNLRRTGFRPDHRQRWFCPECRFDSLVVDYFQNNFLVPVTRSVSA